MSRKSRIEWTEVRDEPHQHGELVAAPGTVWIPKCAEAYFRPRDPAAIPHLPKLLPSAGKAKAGMVRGRP